MSNSPLATYTRITKNKTSPRNHAIDTITIHCIVGQWTAKQGCDYFATTDRQCSANYVVGKDGSIGLSVDEKDRSWCSSNGTNDNRAITIEVASDTTHPYAVTAKAYAALLDLVTDICKRNGIKKLVWSTNKNDRVNHLNGCNMTVHRDYANKSCPGDYLYNRHGQIAAEVNKRLGVKDAGGSTGSQTSGGTTSGLKVGDVVDFKGTQHYTSATAKDAKTCKPGKATITAVAAGKAHPYHLKAISGGGSTVYGWVNAADISTGSTGSQTSGGTTSGLKVGDVVDFKGTQHYTSATAKDAKTCKPGKATITAVAAGKAHPYHLKAISGGGSTVYGWVNAADISTGSTGTATSYHVRVKITNLNIRKGPGTNYGATGYIQPGIYTIVAESTGKGAAKWGKLKSGAGWISLDYATKT